MTTLNKPAILAIILASYVMIVLDASVVLTGLPKIHQELGFTDTGLAWVQSAYTLTFGGLLLLAARAGDILGRRRMLMTGLAVFTAASVAIGMARSPMMLVAARAVQGLGAVAGVAASVGMVLGGVLAEWLSWRAGFFINLPIGLALMAATRRYIVESPRRPAQFDAAGAIASTLGMGALVYGFIRSASTGWSDTVTVCAIAGGLLMLAIFVMHEAGVAQPIMPLRLFANRERVAAYLARMLFLGAMIGFFFFTTQYLQVVGHYSPAATGLAFLPMTLVNFAVAMTVPSLSRRHGNARVLAIGLAVCLAGMAWLSRVSVDSGYLLGVALPMVLIGAGQGMALGPLTAFGIAGVAPRASGAASGVVNVAHQLGNSLGLAILVAVAGAGAGSLQGAALLAHRVTAALTTGAGWLALALLLVWALIVRPQSARRAIEATTA